MLSAEPPPPARRLTGNEVTSLTSLPPCCATPLLPSLGTRDSILAPPGPYCPALTSLPHQTPWSPLVLMTETGLHIPPPAANQGPCPPQPHALLNAITTVFPLQRCHPHSGSLLTPVPVPPE